MDHVSPTTTNNCYPSTNHVSKQPSSIADIYNLTSESAVGSAFAWKPCMYFARGYCKNGSNCRFLHGNYGGHVRSDTNSDHIEKFIGSSSGPLEKLESELKELLRGRSPVSVASLPQLYSERLGKALQAERFTRCRSERDSSNQLASSTSNSRSHQIYYFSCRKYLQGGGRIKLFQVIYCCSKLNITLLVLSKDCRIVELALFVDGC